MNKNILSIGIIVLFIISSISPMVFGNSINFAYDNRIQEVKNINIKPSIVRIKLEPKLIDINIQNTDPKKIKIQSSNNPENIVIADTINNESYPSMVSYKQDCLIAYEQETDGKPYIYLRKSNDFGQNWNESLKLTINEWASHNIPVNSPQLCFNLFIEEVYGVFLSSFTITGLIGNFIIPDISELNSISYFTLNFSKIPRGNGYYSFWNFSSPDIAFNNREGAPWITAFIGSTNYSDTPGHYSCNDSLMFTYQNAYHPTEVWLQWDRFIESCSNLSLDSEIITDSFYGVCEKDNASDKDLLFFKGKYVQNGSSYPYLDLEYFDFTGQKYLIHPEICASLNDIYIIAECIDNGIKDIVIYHSSDDGEDWDVLYPIKTINFPYDFDPRYPQISTYFKNGGIDDIVLTYTEDSNLMMIKSNDSGLNWSYPIQLNDVDSSVVEEFCFIDVPDNSHVLWTDNRNGNNDIYSNLINMIPNNPTIIGPNCGKPDISYNFTFNTIDPDGDDVRYIIDWGDNTSETTDYYASGKNVTLIHSWSVGTFILTVYAQDVYGAIGDEKILTITIKKTKSTSSFPLLRFLERYPLLNLLFQSLAT